MSRKRARQKPSERVRGNRFPPTPHWEAGKGYCRWCGLAVLGKNGEPNMRALWHKDCVNAYLIATRYRKYVKRRDKGVCAKCSVPPLIGAKPWVADHVFPLHLVNREDYPACLFYWSLENLQTLCHLCSLEKTKEELRAYQAGLKAKRDAVIPI